MRITTVPASQLLEAAPAPGEVASVDLAAVVVVAVTGDIDLHTGPDLRRALDDLMPAPTALGAWEATAGAAAPSQEDQIDQEPHQKVGAVLAVIVDMTEVDFIDSYAMGVLVQGHHQARRSGRAYALVAAHPMIRTLFKMTGLARVMPLHPDVATAVGSLRPAGQPTS